MFSKFVRRAALGVTLKTFKPRQITFLKNETMNYLDVRESEDYASGHLESSCNIRIADIEERMNELPPKVCDRFYFVTKSRDQI